jgi:DNA mismatch repair protein MutL
MKIKVLPDVVINQIAAGEVVERPASVVRELVDNAVDAGAADIFVAVESGGHTRIRVRDNGCGMSRDEALLAFERHATSKVTKIDDLHTLTTMGFRGEALASIAAVSKIKMMTRTKDGNIGTLVLFKGGKLVDVQSCPWNEGTEIEIEHLFFNTPARRKFLKSPRSELARIRTWVAHSSLTRPGVRYRLVSDGDEILNLPAVATIAERGAQVFSGDLMTVCLNEGGLSVEGKLGHPGEALSDATGLVVLVNGRLISDKLIMRAVRDGYDSMLKDREFPVGYIAISIPPEHVDVNVHPQKSEVRFSHPDQVFAVVRGAVLAAIRGIRRPMVVAPVIQPAPVMSAPPREEAPGMIARPVPPPVVSRFDWPIPTPSQPVSVAQATETIGSVAVRQVAPVEFAPFQPSFFVHEDSSRYVGGKSVEAPSFKFSDLRYIGQLLGCYLVCELNEKLVVVDMHAAHERVNYNKLRSARSKHALAVQKLLLPEEIRLTEEQVAALLEQGELLKELAFEVEEVNPSTVAVSGIPAVLSHLNCVALVKEIAAEPVSQGWRERLEERIDHITARLACHASVRSGDIINRTEAYALFQQLDDAETAGACPHGRPVVAEFSRDSVERWFGRDR